MTNCHERSPAQYEIIIVYAEKSFSCCIKDSSMCRVTQWCKYFLSICGMPKSDETSRLMKLLNCRHRSPKTAFNGDKIAWEWRNDQFQNASKNLVRCGSVLEIFRRRLSHSKNKAFACPAAQCDGELNFMANWVQSRRKAPEWSKSKFELTKMCELKSEILFFIYFILLGGVRFHFFLVEAWKFESFKMNIFNKRKPINKTA